jgi:hypothetical protein
MFREGGRGHRNPRQKNMGSQLSMFPAGSGTAGCDEGRALEIMAVLLSSFK